MYTLNYVYVNNEDLLRFIENNRLTDKNNLLIQVFSGIVDREFLENLKNFLKNILPQAKIIGTTTDGEIIDCKVLQKEAVISFSVFEKTKIRTLLLDKHNKSSEKLGEIINENINNNTKVAIIFADGLTTNGERLIKNITKNIKISGGFAGDNYDLVQTFVFTEEGLTDLGCAVAFLDSDELYVHNDYSLNWEGIGKILTITKADNNGTVYELDGMPIKEVYKKYFGDLVNEYLLEIGMEFPLITVRDGIKIARAVVNEGEDYLVYAGNLYEGEEVQFGYASINDILSQDVEMFKKLQKNPVESLFIYECTARKKFFNNRIEYEYMPVADVQMSGFYTYGEFFANKEKHFFNQTITYLALSENRDKLINVKETKLYDKDDFLVCQALTNLIKSTSLDLKYTTEKLKVVANTDSLTEILNRKGCFEAINKLTCNYSMLLIDLDHFKDINDKFGHAVGDKVLKGVVDLIKANIRENDIFCRFGGEEFIVILPGVDKYTAVKIAEKIKDLIDRTYIYGMKITISIGVAEYKDDFEKTFKVADENLYKAKKAGRNKVCY
jgi:diguanylate cyclase (GGDEF)-like protein